MDTIVGGKTGTSQNYKNKNKNLNTFISIFPSKTRICFISNVENPQVAKDLIYNYRGIKIKGTRNEAGMEFSVCCWQNNKKNWTNFSHK